MNYINISTLQYPVTEAGIRYAYNTIKFPEKGFQAPSEFREVVETEQPKNTVEGSPESKNGKWFQTWVDAPKKAMKPVEEIIDIAAE
jgi:hypothetical protein